jgi:hypothetical protein
VLPPPLLVQVATARVKGAAKLEIPHIEDHVSKIDCVGLQVGAGGWVLGWVAGWVGF